MLQRKSSVVIFKLQKIGKIQDSHEIFDEICIFWLTKNGILVAKFFGVDLYLLTGNIMYFDFELKKTLTIKHLFYWS